MQIGFDAKRAFYNNSGLGNYARTLIDNFSRLYPAYQLSFFTPGLGNSGWRGVGSVVLPAGSSKYLPRALWRSWAVTHTAQYQQLDIYHGLSHELPFDAITKTVKRVVTIHDLIALKKIEHFPWIDRSIYQKKIRYALAHADRVVAISQQTKQDIMELFSYPEERIALVYQSCHQDYGYNFSAEKEDYLLYVGAFRPRKNLLHLIHAFKLIHAKFPNYILRLAGGGARSYIAQMHALIKRLELSDAVHWDIAPSFGHLKQLYRQAKLFIYPSLYEGFGIPIIEALYSGTPVITTKNSSMQEAAGRGGRFIDPYDVTTTAAAIEELLLDTNLYQHLVQVGQEDLERFSAVQTAGALNQLYQSLIAV